ncbi:hypothetical protein D1632_05620 [Chryseobacterium nematophagum]|uniref:Condensation domain-containing protein n=1 Tax=Chryseobacterium nematophagum TaxID=2305228 RepID=A0A3M7LEC6_9FLAO|nr:hypothetical protein D1632_05620 [Chryseobacterium nematophagum]
MGTPVANRHHSGLEDLIGFFVNTLVLRAELDFNLDISDYLVISRLWFLLHRFIRMYLLRSLLMSYWIIMMPRVILFFRLCSD